MVRRYQYWDHFIASWACGEIEIGSGVTRAKLKRVKPFIMRDDDFWFDILNRHGGDKVSPYEMMAADKATYAHCAGNFCGMLYQSIMSMK